MGRGRYLRAGLVLASLGVLFVGMTHAEVYKWVDEDGNVHFGDKPTDRELADQAEQVDIVEAYQPTERSPEEQSAYERQQEALRRSRRVYEEEDRLAREAREQEQTEQQANLCARLREEIAKFSEMHMVNGVRTYYYFTDEDGKSVSSEEQRAYVADLQKKFTEAGCQ